MFLLINAYLTWNGLTVVSHRGPCLSRFYLTFILITLSILQISLNVFGLPTIQIFSTVAIEKIMLPICSDIYIDSHIITKKSSVKFLGVYMDEDLNWKTQIDFVSSKLRKVSFIIFKASNILNNTRLKILYSLFNLHLDYCSEVIT